MLERILVIVVLVLLILFLADRVDAKVTADYRVADKSLRVTVHTTKKLRSDQKLRVYLAQPCGGAGRDVRPRPGKPSRLTLPRNCKGLMYLGVDLLRDGFRAQNVVTKRVILARKGCFDLRVPEIENC